MPDTPLMNASEETQAGREARDRLELASIRAAQAELDAGLGLDWDDVEEWLERLDTEPDAPMPLPRTAKPQR